MTSLPSDTPLPVGAVASIEQATVPDENAGRDQISTLMDHYLVKNCTKCHQANFGKNDFPGNFRSSGCTSCHMVYANDGLSQSADPSAVKDRPPHPVRHELTTNIPSSQCEHCHYQGARIGLRYRGVIEWGFSEETPPYPNIGESIHGHGPDFYLQGDSTFPPDLHYSAGMECADCHRGRDVHGDGNIYSSSKFQTAIRCENCHGNIDQSLKEGTAVAPLTPGGGGAADDCKPKSGDKPHFLNCNGDALTNLRRREDGSIALTLVNGTGERTVSQIADLIKSGGSPSMMAAMGRHPETGRSHTETLECDACHTSKRQYCFGCHVTMDYSVSRSDQLSGEVTPGSEVTSRSFTSLDLYFLGTNHRGKVQSFCPSMQVFVSAVEPDGKGGKRELFTNQVRRTKSGKVGFNWAVDAPHAVSRAPKPCATCHADKNDDCSTTAARQTYGYGTGRYLWTDNNGETYDLTQLLDTEGNPLVEFSHEGQGPVSKTLREKALGICP